MEIEFDQGKSAKCLAERGFDFEFAAQVFDGPTIETLDPRHIDEMRVKAIGEIDGRCFVVIYTERQRRRIISARRANRKETEQWHATTGL